MKGRHITINGSPYFEEAFERKISARSGPLNTAKPNNCPTFFEYKEGFVCNLLLW